MHSGGIWNDLELQRKNRKKVCKACILMFFETIWNCREKMKTRTVNGKWCILTVFRIWNCREKNESKDGKLCILTVFATMWNCREKNENKDGKWYILTELETIWNCREMIENKDDKCCIVPLFDTIFWPTETILKAMNLNCAFWRYLVRYLDTQINVWK